MAKLIIAIDNQVLSESVLNHKRIIIGSKPTNDIYLNDSAVSAEHASILRMDNDFYLEDLGSISGTLVNHRVIRSRFLKSGDVIEFGKYRATYVNDVPAGKASIAIKVPFDKVAESPTFVNAKNEESQAVAATSAFGVSKAVDATVSKSEGFQLAKVRVLNGVNIGRELTLNKSLTTLGKTGTQVAVISRRSKDYFITHVEGVVFPAINGENIGMQARPLANHDVIELAGVKMEFYFIKS